MNENQFALELWFNRSNKKAIMKLSWTKYLYMKLLSSNIQTVLLSALLLIKKNTKFEIIEKTIK